MPVRADRGRETDLFFDDDASNDALLEVRRFIAGFVERVGPDTPRSGSGSATSEL